ncbi:2-amino-5-chloromuconate deaminase CnbZ [Bosea sp. NPDC003192]|uniref:2-amino-5-chloromuconate deaminase CnbZ n=1 Tax=Bosea sp. NPDC003192 TaxID=3390551 RepID=UPI003CFEA135
MYSTRTSQDGSYRFIPAVYQYSGGVAAEPGFRIERAQLANPVALDRGLQLIEAHLKQVGRPLTALCACELRSPEPFSEGGFDAFNRLYASRLDQWGILQGQVNPVARTNICPEIGKPDAVSLHAFSYTVPDVVARASFVVAGSGEAPEGGASYAQGTIRSGDASPGGVRAKAQWVMGEMEGRLSGLGYGWGDALVTNIYTVRDIHPLLNDVLAPITGLGRPVTWHFSRPPVAVLDYEMDVRGLPREIVIEARG